MRFIVKPSLAFAAVAYFEALGLYFVPLHGRIPASSGYAIFPAAYLPITVDPSFVSVTPLLAPINAAVYGVVGLVLGAIRWFSMRVSARSRP
ncbi:MAG: hypothetical protein WA823_08255 [Candidatus Acidiferrales bacterium]